jgi:hypothetical protein
MNPVMIVDGSFSTIMADIADKTKSSPYLPITAYATKEGMNNSIKVTIIAEVCIISEKELIFDTILW